MYERLEKCPSCKHTVFTNHLICEDHSVTRESFALVKCENCSLVFTNPRPTETQLGKYYESDEYISHSDKANTLVNFLYKIVRQYTLKKKRSLIERYRKPGTILDYGCGTGDFLKTCSDNKWGVTGIEPNEAARNIASKKTGIEILTSIDKLDKEEFDIISAWHVIEHVAELTKTLKQLKKKLSKKGRLIIALPNINSFDSQHYREDWAAYDVPRHLYHFTQSSMRHLAASLDLKITDTLPMKFDSYYVSLLSEKYKHSKSRLVSAFLKGNKSNRMARKSGEYSSLIYVLKKKN